jgi:hypothetical protein
LIKSKLYCLGILKNLILLNRGSTCFNKRLQYNLAIKPLSEHCMKVVFIEVGETKEQAFAKSAWTSVTI